MKALFAALAFGALAACSGSSARGGGGAGGTSASVTASASAAQGGCTQIVDCDTCSKCASIGGCAGVFNACNDSSECVAFVDCVQPCTQSCNGDLACGEACLEGSSDAGLVCKDDHPTGMQLYLAYLHCQCQACPSCQTCPND